ncbi:hypothetical protein, partial [Microcoleus sp. LEGE 07076]|uniref:hypothetical protein n=1 Tax=Microcoleus sp. LEGE 07076 TaxID=915322 RepID=UPI001D133DED
IMCKLFNSRSLLSPKGSRKLKILDRTFCPQILCSKPIQKSKIYCLTITDRKCSEMRSAFLRKTESPTFESQNILNTG